MSWHIFMQIFLIVICAVITTAESAFISINDSRLEKLIESGGKKVQRFKKLADNPKRFLLSSHTAVKITEFISVGFAVVGFSWKIAEFLESAFSEKTSSIISVVIILPVTAFLLITFGEFIPKRMASKNPEKKAFQLSWILSAVSVILFPFVALLEIISCGVLKLMGVNPESAEETVTEEEILMMSDAGAETGAIDEDENRIIKNIFAFDDLTAGQVCTHRTDVSVLWADDDVKVWEEIIHRTRHSVFPVCSKNIDDVVGILDAKDYFRTDVKSRENIMANAVREPYFVHENMKADRLFARMKKSKECHFAVVVDEYGGMSGIVTVTDLVEKLVGDFDDDDSDEAFSKIIKTGVSTWDIHGSVTLGEVCETLGIESQSDKHETFGGYVISLLGDIPKDDERVSVDADGIHIEILKLYHHRIELCRVTKCDNSENREL
ncbi:MAG: hemolysin family protein [Ruminococcus sp.]|nr:hemolysin family protein [Ruminococcus sp.]